MSELSEAIKVAQGAVEEYKLQTYQSLLDDLKIAQDKLSTAEDRLYRIKMLADLMDVTMKGSVPVDKIVSGLRELLAS